MAQNQNPNTPVPQPSYFFDCLVELGKVSWENRGRALKTKLDGVDAIFADNPHQNRLESGQATCLEGVADRVMEFIEDPNKVDTYSDLLDDLEHLIDHVLTEMIPLPHLQRHGVYLAVAIPWVRKSLHERLDNLRFERKRCRVVANELYEMLWYATNHWGGHIDLDEIPTDHLTGSVWNPHSSFAETWAFRDGLAVPLPTNGLVTLITEDIEGVFGITDEHASIDKPAQPRFSRVYALLRSLAVHIPAVGAFETDLIKDVICQLYKFMNDSARNSLRSRVQGYPGLYGQLKAELDKIDETPDAELFVVATRIPL